jgi:biotin carboxyl carrier protein
MADRVTPEGSDDYAGMVRDLLHDLSGTSITRLELRHGDLRVSLRRTPGYVAPAVAPHAGGVGAEAARPEHWHALEAPLTGIFYARPSPDENFYVQVGSPVELDQVVGLIEAMKLFNEITSDVAGTVREIVAENGALVEAGQVLLYVEPGHDASGAPIEAM